MAELRSTVHVHDEHGAPHVFGPGDTVPAWAKKLITNPKVWDGEAVATPAARAVDASAVEAVPGIPPKSGPKATVDAWSAYAEQNGVTVADDATRKDILKALDAAGIPTE